MQIICFSRNRPLQLHGYLTSLMRNTRNIAISVLQRNDPIFDTAYRAIQAEFPSVTFVDESNFSTDLLALLDVSADYICFGCDDVVYVNHISLSDISACFALEPDLIGLSLRLGDNVTRSMFYGPVLQPKKRLVNGWRIWNIEQSDALGDWRYPWELDGTVYRADFVHAMTVGIADRAASPNSLEANGANCWQQYTDRRMLASFWESRLVVPTVNVVQTDFPNGTVGSTLSPEFLLDCWDAGLRMDLDAYLSYAPFDAVHIGDFFLRRQKVA